MVVLVGAHHKVEDLLPPPPGSCSQTYTFCYGIFFCLESPDMKKLLMSSKFFLIIDCWYRKSARQPIFDTSLRFYTVFFYPRPLIRFLLHTIRNYNFFASPLSRWVIKGKVDLKRCYIKVDRTYVPSSLNLVGSSSSSPLKIDSRIKLIFMGNHICMSGQNRWTYRCASVRASFVWNFRHFLIFWKIPTGIFIFCVEWDPSLAFFFLGVLQGVH